MANILKNIEISSEAVFLYHPITQAVADTEIDPENKPEPSANEVQQEEIRAEAYQQGYESGKEAGHNLAQEQLLGLTEQLQTLVSSIPETVAQNRLELHSEIADIVLLIIQELFVEQHTSHSALESQINSILSQANSKQSLELSLHPQDIIALQQGAIQLDTSHLNGLKIKGDASLRLGGCIIKTDHGVFNASIEQQIDRLKHFLLQLKQGEHHASTE